jgi:hypothetical protein
MMKKLKNVPSMCEQGFHMKSIFFHHGSDDAAASE